MNKRELKMVGHGSIIMIIGLLAGFGLVMSLVGGFEIYPTNILKFEMPGTPSAWVRAHSGGIMNGLMIILVAVVMNKMQLPTFTCKKLYWMLVGAGYANTLFYYGGLFAGNHRALTFGDNPLGKTSIAGVIGILPALIFAFVLIVAFWILMKSAFQKAKESN
ncbi:hypothetical protein SAMN04489761_0809 [Tenacibaculum sp. MAR_2009_124]|uniref:styrene-oxide isomerase StyC n=1 Tax=Tenacibaculum sp. MAR_2009_124 TaxID=1250059 RepID=UPI00089C6143|nr:hypothetical protein [Tenacibaculum sp. MAR_2009_124]SEB45326.1 hypothetical protein SAMN04489761_0809 [Tenacibaculum sp. MAR_2009_124]